jgi:hypothetical protein
VAATAGPHHRKSILVESLQRLRGVLLTTRSFHKALASSGHPLSGLPLRGVGFGRLHASGEFAGPFLRANKKPAARWEPLSRIRADAGVLYVRTTGTSEYTPIRL